MENNQRGFATQFQRALLQVADSTTVHKMKKLVSLSHIDISVIFLLSQNFWLKFSFDFVGKFPWLVHAADKVLMVTAFIYLAKTAITEE